MRAVLTILLLGAALWCAVVDWQATIGTGYAYRLSSLGGWLATGWPDAHAGLVRTLVASRVTWAWDPVGAFLLSLPLALVLAAAGFGLWITRDRRRSR
jgi:hypothetical protein